MLFISFTFLHMMYFWIIKILLFYHWIIPYPNQNKSVIPYHRVLKIISRPILIFIYSIFYCSFYVFYWVIKDHHTFESYWQFQWKSTFKYFRRWCGCHCQELLQPSHQFSQETEVPNLPQPFDQASLHHRECRRFRHCERSVEREIHKIWIGMDLMGEIR